MTPQNNEPILRSPIGLTELAWEIVDSEITKSGCRSRSDYLEWLILCQRFGAAEATALWNLRRRRGGLGGVIVVPDDFALPPEG